MSNKEPIGYTNEVPGNEGTKLVPIYELTTQQMSIKASADQLVESIAALEKTLEQEIDRLKNVRTKMCKHHVHRDEGGFPYNQRWCVICGAYMGML